MNAAAALVGWIMLTFGAAMTGLFIQPAGYYAALAKPVWAMNQKNLSPAYTTRWDQLVRVR